jgi:hypothetical protein
MRKLFPALYMLFVSLILLSGCTSKEEQWSRELEALQREAARQLERLESHLSLGHLRNADLLTLYAQRIKVTHPEMAEIANALARDATSNGPLFQGLKARLEDAGAQIKTATARGEPAVNELARELQSIQTAAKPDVFNAALSDPVNVLADMSGGELGHVEAMAGEAMQQSRNVKDFGAGSQLIGNPNYGHWQQRSDGTSFWEFYGMYALLSNLTRPIFYGDWARHRRYSYYNDYGWNHYQSPKQRQAAAKTFERAKQKFARQGKTFESPYAKYRNTSVNRSARFSQVNKTPGKFGSGSRFQSGKYASGSTKSRRGFFSSPYNSRGSRYSRSFGGGGK